jgi:hypothetical protein
MKHYKATNLKTGEVIQGSAREIFQKTGIITNYLYKYAQSGTVYMETWRFEPLSEKKKIAKGNTMNLLDCQKWDWTTKIFKEASERKAAKPQKTKEHKLRTPYNTIQ